MAVVAGRHSPAITVERSEKNYKVAGLLLASIVPALFWSAILLAMSSVFGFAVATSTVLIVGIGIGCFIGAVCAPLML